MKLFIDDGEGMTAERCAKVFRRKSLSVVNTKGSGGSTREELGIEARFVFDQGVMRGIQFLSPSHFNRETHAIKKPAFNASCALAPHRFLTILRKLRKLMDWMVEKSRFELESELTWQFLAQAQSLFLRAPEQGKITPSHRGSDREIGRVVAGGEGLDFEDFSLGLSRLCKQPIG
jgi:hypothetical protein